MTANALLTKVFLAWLRVWHRRPYFGDAVCLGMAPLYGAALGLTQSGNIWELIEALAGAGEAPQRRPRRLPRK